MELATGVLLGQDAAQGEVGRVRLHCDWQVKLEVQHNGGRSEGQLELLEGRICCWRPDEADALVLGPLLIVPSASLVSVPNPHLCASSVVFSCASSG